MTMNYGKTKKSRESEKPVQPQLYGFDKLNKLVFATRTFEPYFPQWWSHKKANFFQLNKPIEKAMLAMNPPYNVLPLEKIHEFYNLLVVD